MNSTNTYPVPADFINKTNLNAASYHALYQQSIVSPEQFWAEQAEKFISWLTPWSQVVEGDFIHQPIKWFIEGKLNACYNCLDRHLATRAEHIALIWEGNSPDESQSITYAALHERVCQFANVLKNQGVVKGDRVCIYLPMIPEAVVAMLACARIGAIHSVVFGGFSSEALSARLVDAQCKLLITADEGLRGEKIIPFKKSADEALLSCPMIHRVIVVKRTGNAINWHAGRDHWYHELMAHASKVCPIEPMDANDPLFILYTSGSTGKPKGVVHHTGGYLVYVAMTFYYVFDYHVNDVHWCTADIGWITGHSYLVYGPLANGATTLLFEGIPTFPNPSRYWSIIDKHHVTLFYTAPTALRALRQDGNQWVNQTSRKTLRLLGSVGEPINPEVWAWYYHVVGEARCPIVNTWWQTETGGILLTSLPGATPLKGNSAGVPFFGVVPEIIKDAPESESGSLVIAKPWPGLMHTLYGDQTRFIETYFKSYPGKYLTGDGAYCDASGYYWVTGRVDDVLNLSGHRLGTEELESAFISHPAVAQAGVVGIPHPIKGEAIYAFVTINEGIARTEALKKELTHHVREVIGPLATPEVIQWAYDLPKTRSGKIMRRILRKIANHEYDTLGDVSTLVNPEVVSALIENL